MSSEMTFYLDGSTDGLSWLCNEVTTSAWCCKISRLDGVVLAFTNHDRDLTVGGTTYSAAVGFSPTAVETSSDMSVDNLDIEGVIDDASITLEDLESGKFDGATVEISIVDWSSPESTVGILRRGVVGQTVYTGIGYTAEIRGLLDSLQRNASEVTQKSCRASLGDSKCKMSVSPTVGLVHSVNSDDSLVTDLTAVDEYYDYGTLTWSAGKNAGTSYEVKNYVNAYGKVLLFLPTYWPVESGDTFTIKPGCDGNLSTCKNRFNNVVNFRGEPHLPGTDYAVSYPTSR